MGFNFAKCRPAILLILSDRRLRCYYRQGLRYKRRNSESCNDGEFPVRHCLYRLPVERHARIRQLWPVHWQQKPDVLKRLLCLYHEARASMQGTYTRYE